MGRSHRFSFADNGLEWARSRRDGLTGRPQLVGKWSMMVDVFKISTRKLQGDVYACLLYVAFMTTPFIQISPSPLPQTPTPATRGRGAKRGRKPRGAVLSSGPTSHQASAGGVTTAGFSAGGVQFTPVQWTNPTAPVVGPTPVPVPTSAAASQPIVDGPAGVGASDVAMDSEDEAGPSTSTTIPPGVPTLTTAANSATAAAGGGAGAPKLGAGAGDEDGEGDDELLPAMADDDYSAQLSWQSESKDNLKCVLYPSVTRISSDTRYFIVGC